MNALHTVIAYRLPKNPCLWAFDDERFGLHEEPLLWDASDLISAVVGEATRATIIFSDRMFPGASAILCRTWTGEHVAESGCDYLAHWPIDAPGKNRLGVPESGIENPVWLCTAMTHYFGADCAPEFIYAQIVPWEDAAL
jgi:hypothetical protein